MKYRVYIDVSKAFCYTVDAESAVEAEEKAKERAKEKAYNENYGVFKIDVFDIEEVTED